MSNTARVPIILYVVTLFPGGKQAGGPDWRCHHADPGGHREVWRTLHHHPRPGCRSVT